MSRQQSNDFERDAELTALYRAAPAEEPPAALDDAIRAAARREVRAGPAFRRCDASALACPHVDRSSRGFELYRRDVDERGSSRIRTGASTTRYKWRDGAVSGAR